MSRAERIAQHYTLGQIGDMRRFARSRGLRRCSSLLSAAFEARFDVIAERNCFRQASLFPGEGDEP